MKFSEQFRAARRVSTPLVDVKTFDAASAIEQMRTAIGGFENVPVIVWDSVHGFRAMTESGTAQLTIISQGNPEAIAASANPAEALRMAERLGEVDALVIFHNSHLVWSDSTVIQAVWNLRDSFTANGNMLVLLSSPGANLPAELVNDVLSTDEPLPGANELQTLIRDEFAFAKCEAPAEETIQRATDALIGLPTFPARQSVAMCLDNLTGKLNIPELWERKRKVIAQTPGCSVYSGTETLADVRGLQSVVTFLQKRMTGKNPPKCILFQDEVEKMFAGTGTDMSGVKTELTGSYCTWFEQEEAEGITFIGLPGVSKSALAKAVANEYGLPLILFDVAAMQSAMVGSSGANLRGAQKIVSAMSQRRLLVISTCNGIESVPPEVRRRIGSLGIFFFDAPGADERADILTLYRHKYEIPAEQSNPDTTGWTGAEIKECCRKADIFGMTLTDAARYVVPVTRSASDRIRALRLNSSGKYLSASKFGEYAYTEDESSAAPTIASAAMGRKVRDTRDMN